MLAPCQVLSKIDARRFVMVAVHITFLHRPGTESLGGEQTCPVLHSETGRNSLSDSQVLAFA